MAHRLAGKVALVTGGSSGIGQAAALAFSRAGAKVVVSDITPEHHDETVAQISADGGEAQFIRADVSRDAEVAALVAQTVVSYGRLDCAFNNAGIEGATIPTHEYDPEEWARVLSINLTGVWLCMRHQIPQMLQQGGGAIVNTASVAGLVASPGLSAYVASKHAVVGLTKTAAVEYAPHNIRVNAVCPGVILTPMVQRALGSDEEISARQAETTPMGRAGKPQEIADAVVWLCSEGASFVTGAALTIDGGFVAQ